MLFKVSPFLLLSGGLLVATAAEAAEPTAQECIAASERAQGERRDGKLRASRGDFARCTVEACPGPIRADCKDQLAAVMRDLPTIVFVVANGAPAFQVTVDGEPLTERIGDAFAIDPGDHMLTFTGDGHSPISKTITIRAAEKDRRESVPFAGVTRTDSAPASTTASSSRWLHDVGFASVGAGALGVTLGIVLGVVAKTTYDDAQTHCHATACDVDGVAGGRTALRTPA